MKKMFKVLGMMLCIMMLILVMYFIMIHFNGFLDKSNMMSRDEVVTLLEKGKSYPNYYYSSHTQMMFYEYEENNTEYFIKDGIVKCMNNGMIMSWTNYNTDENITFMTTANDGKTFASVSKVSSPNNETNPNSQMFFDYSLIADEEMTNMDFEYMGEGMYYSRPTILVKVWNKDSSKLNSTIFYIDKDTGLIMRRIDYFAFGFMKMDCNRNVKMDIVTDKDIERPNLDGFEIMPSMEMQHKNKQG